MVTRRLEVRPIISSDMDAVVAYVKEKWKAAPNYQALTLDRVQVYRQLRRLIKGDEGFAWAVFYEGRVHGVLLGAAEQAAGTRELWASDVFFVVDGFGGRSLCRAFESWAKRLGVCHLTLGVSCGGEHAKTAESFIERLGYQPAATTYWKAL